MFPNLPVPGPVSLLIEVLQIFVSAAHVGTFSPSPRLKIEERSSFVTTWTRILGGLAIIGFGAALIGGVVGIDTWFHIGALVFSGGILMIWLFALWKRPTEVIESAIDDGPIECGDHFSIGQAEETLASRNRGTIPIRDERTFD